LKIIRTANAGVLLSISGVTVLIDGVCNDFLCYSGTPEYLRKEFYSNPPDIIAFTHMHEDHCDKDFLNSCKTPGSFLGPGSSLLAKEKNVSVKGICTRHIGSDKIDHVSYVIEAEKCIWFMGDASPSELRKMEEEKNPDIIIAPYAYANTASSWERTLKTGAEKFVILHLPSPDADSFGIKKAVLETVKNDDRCYLPDMGEEINI